MYLFIDAYMCIYSYIYRGAPPEQTHAQLASAASTLAAAAAGMPDRKTEKEQVAGDWER